jgi:cell fate (sporulation/competence/biofilm development) regulator YmcA (YheA/YmcA/DUF963 family)
LQISTKQTEIVVENIEIAKKLDELLSLIEQDIAIKAYKEIEDLIDNDPKLQYLIKKSKKKQAIYMQNAFCQQEKMRINKDKYAKDLRNELKNPLVIEYNEKLKHADDLICYVTRLLESEIQKKVEGSKIE